MSGGIEAYEALRRQCDCLWQFANEEATKEIFTQSVTDADLRRRLDGLVRSASALRGRVEESKMTIAFLGATSAGKSTTLNCLMRADRLRCSLRPTTFCPASIESTPEGESFFRTEAGKTGRLSDRRLNDLESLLTLNSNDALHFYISLRDCEGTILENQRLRLVDFPGWNEDAIRLARSQLENADVVVNIIDSVAGADVKKIREILRSLPTASKNSVFLAYNKLDILQKESQKTKEKLIEDSFKEAERILVADNGVFQTAAEAREATYMFSATDAFLVRSSDSVADVERALMADSGQNVGQIVVCGSRSIGKTSLCNQLLRASFLPVSPNSAPGWIVCHPPKGPRSLVNGATAGGQRLEEVLESSEEALVAVHPASSLVKTDGILGKGHQLVDASTDREMFKKHRHLLGEAKAVLIVVSDKKRLDVIEKEISEIIRFVSDAKKTNETPSIFLVVNLWEKAKKERDASEQPRLKESIRSSFADLAKPLQSNEKSRDRVFFMTIKDLGEKEESARGFERFEQRLLQAARDQYVDLKIRKLSAAMSGKALELQNLLSDDLKSWFGDAQEICEALADFEVEVSASSTQDCEDVIAAFLSNSPLLRQGSFPNTDEEKQAMVEEFYDFLCTSHRDRYDRLIARKDLDYFPERYETMRDFVQKLCARATAKAFERFSEITADERKGRINEMRDKARLVSNASEPHKNFFLNALSKGASLTTLFSYVSGFLKTITKPLALALAAAHALPFAVSEATCLINSNTWPALNTRQEVKKFLESFDLCWFFKFVKILNKAQQQIALEENQQLVGCATRIEALTEEFVEKSCQLETEVRQTCDGHQSSI